MHLSHLERFDSCRVSGVDFDFPGIESVVTLIDNWRNEGRRCYVSLVNPHSVMMCKRDERFDAAIAGADLVLPDGIGIVLACRLLGHGRRHRITGPGLMLHLCDAGRDPGFRHYFYGGAAGVADRLAERLRTLYPGLEVAGTHAPPFRELSAQEDAADVERINAARPDVVWVGMGAPKQEKWMAAHANRIRAAAMIGVGAAFDFHSGNVRWAPRWLRATGCEWAYRLVLEPKRMWRRNLDSPMFLGLVAIDSLAACFANLLDRIKPMLKGSFFDDMQGGGGIGAGESRFTLHVAERKSSAAPT